MKQLSKDKANKMLFDLTNAVLIYLHHFDVTAERLYSTDKARLKPIIEAANKLDFFNDQNRHSLCLEISADGKRAALAELLNPRDRREVGK